MFAPLTRGVARSAGGLLCAALLALLAAPLAVDAQQPRLYRVGVVLHGGAYTQAIEGLRHGLKALSLEEGRHFVLHLRNTRGDLKSVAAAAKSLEAEKVDLIYSLATSVTVEVKRATKSVPIVFYAGTDPVAFGLVESFRRPGGRLTGIVGQWTDITGKRLQLLKEMLPNLRRVLTFYSTDNPRVVGESLKIARDVARQLKIELIARPVGSVEELRTALQALQPREADAFLYIPDAMMQSQAPLVIKAAMAKSLPAMFADKQSANEGALASYGVSYYAIGRLSAKYVQRVLQGAQPGELPVEQIGTPYFVINLKTAKALGFSIPASVLTRADEVIQ